MRSLWGAGEEEGNPPLFVKEQLTIDAREQERLKAREAIREANTVKVRWSVS